MKKALGKGLSALIPDSYKEQMAIQTSKEMPSGSVAVQERPAPAVKTLTAAPRDAAFKLIAVDKILPNEEQPRKTFNQETIEELASSIKEKGVLQPVIVKKAGDGVYRLICGERRYRAAIACGLTEVPAIIKDIAQEDFLEWALIENIQREDLNPLEEAEAYQRLVEDRVLSQEEVAKRVGKNRATVANMLRLLRLPDEVKQFLLEGRLSAGHARALLGLLSPEHQRHMAKRIVEENLSVRQVEAIVGRSLAHKRKAKTARHLSAEIVDLETRLTHFLGTQAKIFPRKNQKEGRIEIQYFSLDDLDRVLQKLGLPRG